MNHFQFYDLPIQFELDEAALRRTFLRLSKQYHPDFYTLDSDEKQAEILELSTRNNEAYKTLKDPNKRLHYILQIKGLIQEGTGNLPQAFLMEMMDLNEAVMELQIDYSTDQHTVLKTQLQQQRQALRHDIASLLKEYNDTQATKEQLEAIRDYYYKNRYLQRLEENLNKVAESGEF